jgi:tetratricopeptide (TPR) repeat protein
MGDDEYAASLANDAVRQAPAHAFPQAVRAQILMAQRDFQEAENAARKAVSAAPDQPDTLLLLARAQLANSRFEQCHETLYRLSQLMPTMPGLQEVWGQLQQAQYNHQLRKAQAEAAAAAAAAQQPAWKSATWERGGGITSAPTGPPPPSNLVLSIVAIFFCTFGGIIALLNAVKVKGLWAAGDVSGAREASRKARSWALWSIVPGIVLLVFVVALGQLAPPQ